jgi:hypothetical protein
MKQQIESLQAKIGKLMQDHLATRDFNTVTLLSPLLSRVQELQKRSTDLEREVLEIETTLKGLNGKPTPQRVAEVIPQLTAAYEDAEEGGRGRPQTLRIKIDWKANGRSRESETVCHPTAAASMAAFVARLAEELGPEALQKLARIRINRGPLLSKTPATDFLNQAQGTLYGHKKLKGTDQYILTHSQTSQKVDDLNKICRVLGLKPGSVQIEKIDRFDSYE